MKKEESFNFYNENHMYKYNINTNIWNRSNGSKHKLKRY